MSNTANLESADASPPICRELEAYAEFLRTYTVASENIGDVRPLQELLRAASTTICQLDRYALKLEGQRKTLRERWGWTSNAA